MTYLQAVILGITEGLTEYLPVSSTGHLYLVSQLLGLGVSAHEKTIVNAYLIAIQIGAIIAVMWLYSGRISQMTSGILGRNPGGRRIFIHTCIAFLPAAVIALVFEGFIKGFFFGIWPITFAWFAGGMAILLVSNRMWAREGKGLALEDLTYRQALLIGFIQCIAMWPGMSRSLVVILGGILAGLSLQAAVEFSFLLGLITLGAATSYEIVKEGPSMITMFGWASPALGLLAAFISAVAAVKWMVGYLNSHSLKVFGYYRIALACVTAILVLSGVL